MGQGGWMGDAVSACMLLGNGPQYTHTYTHTLSHSVTQDVHNHTHSVTQPLSHTVTQPLSHTVTQSHSHTVTQSHRTYIISVAMPISRTGRNGASPRKITLLTGLTWHSSLT